MKSSTVGRRALPDVLLPYERSYADWDYGSMPGLGSCIGGVRWDDSIYYLNISDIPFPRPIDDMIRLMCTYLYVYLVDQPKPRAN